METVKSEILDGRSFRQSTVDLKKLRTRMKKVEKDIEQVTNSIINLNTEVLIGTSETRDLEKVIKNLEKYRLNLEVEKEDLIKEDRDQQQNRDWVDWMKEFGKKVDQLRNSNMSLDEKKRFVEGVVETISVKSLDTQKHELNFLFRFPYVKDRLVWNDDKNKKRGYRIKSGSTNKRVRVNLLKKSMS